MIHDLKRQGLSLRAIARQAGLDRKTVRKYLDSGLKARAYTPRDPRPCLIDPYAAYLQERVARYPDFSGRRLFREIRDLGYEGGYTAVTDFLRDARPPKRPVFERRFETPPGQQAQVDFAEFAVEFADEPGVTQKVWLFSMNLGHCRWLSGQFCASQNLHCASRAPSTKLLRPERSQGCRCLPAVDLASRHRRLAAEALDAFKEKRGDKCPSITPAWRRAGCDPDFLLSFRNSRDYLHDKCN